MLVFTNGYGTQKPGKAIEIELFSGFNQINPTDLNHFPDHTAAYYHYWQNYYGNLVTSFSIDKDGKTLNQLETLKSAIHVGGKIRFDFSRRKNAKILFSLGISYLQKTIENSLKLTIQGDDYYHGSYHTTIDTNPHYLWLDAFTPQAGMIVKILKISSVQLETSVTGGIILARCQIFEQSLSLKSDEFDYSETTENIINKDGSGHGLMVSASLKLHTPLFFGTKLFVESGYNLQKIGKIKGNAFYKYNYKNNNGDGYSTLSQWSGDWILHQDSYGKLPQIYYSQLNSASVSDFNLDLSGFYLRIGLIFGLF
jgi:hypothetical protein